MKIVTERYGRAEGAKNVVLHSKLHRARGGGSADLGSVTHALRGGGSAADFWKKKRYVIIGRSLRDRPINT